MKKKILMMGAIFGAGIFAYNCGGGESGAGESGTISLYFTDAPADMYPVVEVTVYEANLCRDATCTDKVNLFSDPNGIVIDLTNLNGILQYIDTANIPQDTYSRLEIILAQRATICDNTGTCNPAIFTEMSESPTKHNEVNCPPGIIDQNGNQLCYIRYSGTVNPFVDGKIVVDFNLKGFEVNTSTTPWQINDVEVKPLTPSQVSGAHKYKIYAVIQSVDSTDNTFAVDWKGQTYTVSVTNTTKCEISDINYFGSVCTNQLSQDICVEIKVQEDPSTTNTLTAIEVEAKSPHKCGSGPEDYSYEGHAKEIKEAVESIDIANSSFTLSNYPTPIKVTDKTVCEYNDVYYIGADCVTNLQPNWFVEVKIDSNNNAIKIERES